jgi:hypothetical protein
MKHLIPPSHFESFEQFESSGGVESCSAALNGQSKETRNGPTVHPASPIRLDETRGQVIGTLPSSETWIAGSSAQPARLIHLCVKPQKPGCQVRARSRRAASRASFFATN